MSGQTGLHTTSPLLTPASTRATTRQAKTGDFRGRWDFSLFLGVTYLAVFHAWLVLNAAAVLGCAVAATLWMVLRRSQRAGYFFNVWDKRFHEVVIVDLLLESFIPLHEGYGFYWCAASFAAVVGGYRFWAQHNSAHL